MDLWITTAERAETDPTLATFLFERLAGMVARRHTATDARQRVALARGTFSVYLDCRDLGLGPQAAAIVARGQAAPAAGAGRSTR